MWKHHDVYQSRPRSVFITLGKQIYKILEAVPKTGVSLIIAKKCRKLISQTRKFVLFMVRSESKRKVIATSTTSKQGISQQQKHAYKIVEAHKDIFSMHDRVPLHFQVKKSIDLIPRAPLPNGPVYRCSLKENEEIK